MIAEEPSTKNATWKRLAYRRGGVHNILTSCTNDNDIMHSDVISCVIYISSKVEYLEKEES